jgi:hypothetical protein
MENRIKRFMRRFGEAMRKREWYEKEVDGWVERQVDEDLRDHHARRHKLELGVGD